MVDARLASLMIPPRTPKDELDRLRRLRALNVLDTPDEERFDRYSRIAQSLFQTPMAAVAFVDEKRQWFKSQQGLTVRETPREISFCGHAIVEPGVFVVRDASRDCRFSDNPLVTGPPKIRFYAGCPIPPGMGSGLGTLCVMDRKPRELSTHEARLLADLGCMLANEIMTLDLATMDDLTQVATRGSFLALAQREIDRAITGRKGLTLMRFAIDAFHNINEHYGHAEGDEALREFADALKRAVRSSDVTGRVGGDEFCVAMPGAAPEHAERVLALARRILAQLGARRERPYDLSFSVGIVELDPARHESVEALMAEAASTTHAAKRQPQAPPGALWQARRVRNTRTGQSSRG
jgi:diguanylate cyclase (GGDEF)-like protein